MRVIRTRAALAFFTVLLLLVAAERPTYAYVDPGTASYLFQFLIGGLLSTLYLVRTYWSRIKEFIGERFSRPRAAR